MKIIYHIKNRFSRPKHSFAYDNSFSEIDALQTEWNYDIAFLYFKSILIVFTDNYISNTWIVTNIYK